MSDARKNPVFGNAGENSMQNHSHPEEKAERLRDELADYLDEVDEFTLDSDRLEVILDALEELDPMPEFSDDAESLKRFHQRHAADFAVAEAAEPAAMISSSPSRKRSPRFWLKLLPVAAILILLLGSIMAQAFNWGGLFNFIRWDSGVFQVGGETVPHATITKMPLEEGAQATYATLQEALDAFGIDEQLAPQWIPERFELVEVVAYNKRDYVSIYADFTGENDFFMLQYREATPETTGFEQSMAHVNMRSYSGIKHYLMPELDRYKAYWRNGELACYLDGTVSQEEMVQIIESIYEEK